MFSQFVTRNETYLPFLYRDDVVHLTARKTELKYVHLFVFVERKRRNNNSPLASSVESCYIRYYYNYPMFNMIPTTSAGSLLRGVNEKIKRCV